MERLSHLPDYIVEAILERLPMHDAVRTSILSRYWHHKWETISRLRLDCDFFDSVCESVKSPSIDYYTVVRNIMLQHHASLTEFVIHIPDSSDHNDAEINLIVCCALRKGVRKLSVKKADTIPHELPSLLFSAAEQPTQLQLENCTFNPPVHFNGFPNLKSLDLEGVSGFMDRLSTFISSCQELRRIRLDNLYDPDHHLCVHAVKVQHLHISGVIRSVSLEGVQDLVYLSLRLEDISEHPEEIRREGYLLQSLGQLRKIKHLRLIDFIFDYMAVEHFPAKLSPGLYHLMKIAAICIELCCFEQLHCLICMIRSSPNLQELEISVCISLDIDTADDGNAFTQIYEDCPLQHLKTVIFRDLKRAKAELRFVEFILCCSPVLETISIEPMEDLDGHEKLELLTELARCRRASPQAQLLFN